VALLGYMYRDLVEKRKWIAEGDYKEGLALAQLMPGPLAAQLAIYLGYVHYRLWGATLVGVAFVLPSFVMVVAIGAAYTRYGGIEWMQAVFYGVGAAVIGIIAVGAYKLTTKNIGKDRLLWGIFLLSAVVTIVTKSEIAGCFLEPASSSGSCALPPRPVRAERCTPSPRHSWRGSHSTTPIGTSSARSLLTSRTPAASCSAAAWRSFPSSMAAWFRNTTG
jgi:chromate transporter